MQSFRQMIFISCFLLYSLTISVRIDSLRGVDYLGELFQDLNNSVLSADGKILRIPSTRQDIPSFELYVRECWVKIYDLIFNGYKYNKKYDFVVTGSPMIGKSAFSYYFMWRCMREDGFNGFYWEREKGKIIHYTSTGVTRIINTYLYFGVFEHTPHFIDLIEKAYPTCVAPRYRVIFCSSNPIRYKEFQKGNHSVGFVQPPWTLTEVLEAHSRINRIYESIKVRDVRRMFGIYGGIPQYLFDNKFRDERAMTEALAKRGIFAMEAAMGAYLDTIDEYDSYLIIHMYADDTEDFSLLGSWRLPASQYVMKELERRNILTMDVNNVVYKYWRRDPLNQRRSWIFRTLCRKLLPNSAHRLQPLQPKSRREVELSCRYSFMSRREILLGTQAMDPGSQMTPKKLQLWTPDPTVLYFRSVDNNEESWDAYTTTRSHELLIFYFTTSVQHTIDVKGLKKLLNRLNGCYHIARIVFVCPDFHPVETIQDFVVINNKKCTRIPQIIKKYHLDTVQYVLLLPFPHH